MLFNMNVIYCESSYACVTICQHAESYLQATYVPAKIAAEKAPQNVLPIRHHSSLKKQARTQVTRFEREFLI